MNLISLFAVATSPALIASALAGRTVVEYLIYCGVLLVVAAALFFWAITFRKPQRRRKRKYRSSSRRNPTLSETRGLPPMRGGQSSQSDDPHS